MLSGFVCAYHPGFESQAHHLSCFYSRNLYYICHCIEKRTKINKKLPGFAAHILDVALLPLASCLTLTCVRNKAKFKGQFLLKSSINYYSLIDFGVGSLTFKSLIPGIEGSESTVSWII